MGKQNICTHTCTSNKYIIMRTVLAMVRRLERFTQGGSSKIHSPDPERKVPPTGCGYPAGCSNSFQLNVNIFSLFEKNYHLYHLGFPPSLETFRSAQLGIDGKDQSHATLDSSREPRNGCESSQLTETSHMDKQKPPYFDFILALFSLICACSGKDILQALLAGICVTSFRP